MVISRNLVLQVATHVISFFAYKLRKKNCCIICSLQISKTFIDMKKKERFKLWLRMAYHNTT